MILLKMPGIQVQIVRFVDEAQPGIVESQFRDAQGEVHSIIDKVPIFTAQDLWSDSDYPQPGVVRCEVLERVDGSLEEHLVKVTIAEPDGVETTHGKTEFVVRVGDPFT